MRTFFFSFGGSLETYSRSLISLVLTLSWSVSESLSASSSSVWNRVGKLETAKGKSHQNQHLRSHYTDQLQQSLRRILPDPLLIYSKGFFKHQKSGSRTFEGFFFLDSVAFWGTEILFGLDSVNVFLQCWFIRKFILFAHIFRSHTIIVSSRFGGWGKWRKTLTLRRMEHSKEERNILINRHHHSHHSGPQFPSPFRVVLSWFLRTTAQYYLRIATHVWILASIPSSHLQTMLYFECP